MTMGRGVCDDKSKDDALRRSEARLRSILRAAPAGIGVVINRVLAEVNDRLCDMTGFSREELLGQSARVLYPTQEDFEFVGREKYRQITAHGTGTVETRWMKKDGTVLQVLLSSSPIDPSDLATGVTFTAFDISERKRAEQELRTSEENYRRITENMHDLVCETDVQGCFRYITPSCRRVVGYDPKELLGESVFARIHPDDRAQAMAVFEEGVRNRTEREVEFRYRHADGRYIWFCSTGSFLFDASGTFTGAVISSRDVTERKEAEAALVESEKRFSVFMEHLPAAAFIKDYEGRTLFANRYLQEIFSWQDPTGKTTAELLPPEIAERMIADDQKVLTEGPRVIQETVTDVSGRTRVFDTYKFPIAVEGSAALLGGIAVDITDRIRAEDERSRLEAQMREVQKLESLGVLAGGIAHDFNNILMAILGNADLALLALSPASPAWQNLQEITRASQRAADLCRQMLAYSGKGRFVVGRYDLSEIVREMAQMLEISVSKKASLRYSFARELPPVEADVTQLRQIIMNLITNASEALGDENGVISIATGVMECDRDYLAESYLDDNLPAGTVCLPRGVGHGFGDGCRNAK